MAEKQPATGRGGKYNFPNARMKRLEETDKGRELISKTLNNHLVFYEVGQNPVKNDEELCERLNWFFRTCADTGQLPTVEKMALALGYAISTIYDWETGRRSGFSSNTATIIKKAKEVIQAMDGELALGFRIQPAVYMFRAKNYYGMKDQQDIVVSPSQTPLGDEVDAEELKKKLDANKIIDVDDFMIVENDEIKPE